VIEELLKILNCVLGGILDSSQLLSNSCGGILALVWDSHDRLVGIERASTCIRIGPFEVGPGEVQLLGEVRRASGHFGRHLVGR